MFNRLARAAPVAVGKDELIAYLRSDKYLPNWILSNNSLQRNLVFKTYEDTWAFLTRLSMRAHLWGHHPTIITTYTNVEVRLQTHDLKGDWKISDIDLKMATKIEKMLEKNRDNIKS